MLENVGVRSGVGPAIFDRFSSHAANRHAVATTATIPMGLRILLRLTKCVSCEEAKMVPVASDGIDRAKTARGRRPITERESVDSPGKWTQLVNSVFGEVVRQLPLADPHHLRGVFFHPARGVECP